MHPVRNHRDAAGRVQTEPQDFISSGRADRNHVRRLPEPTENSFRHGPKPTRARFAFGLKHATEGVEIVTRDHGSAGRQIVDQLRVAVVYQMKQIERLGLRL